MSMSGIVSLENTLVEDDEYSYSTDNTYSDGEISSSEEEFEDFEPLDTRCVDTTDAIDFSSFTTIEDTDGKAPCSLCRLETDTVQCVRCIGQHPEILELDASIVEIQKKQQICLAKIEERGARKVLESDLLKIKEKYRMKKLLKAKLQQETSDLKKEAEKEYKRRNKLKKELSGAKKLCSDSMQTSREIKARQDEHIARAHKYKERLYTARLEALALFQRLFPFSSAKHRSLKSLTEQETYVFGEPWETDGLLPAEIQFINNWRPEELRDHYGTQCDQKPAGRCVLQRCYAALQHAAGVVKAVAAMLDICLPHLPGVDDTRELQTSMYSFVSLNEEHERNTGSQNAQHPTEHIVQHEYNMLCVNVLYMCLYAGITHDISLYTPLPNLARLLRNPPVMPVSPSNPPFKNGLPKDLDEAMDHMTRVEPKMDYSVCTTDDVVTSYFESVDGSAVHGFID